MILAKPRGGKTTLAKELEARLGLVRIATDSWIAQMFEKVKLDEEEPIEEEIPEEER